MWWGIDRPWGGGRGLGVRTLFPHVFLFYEPRSVLEYGVLLFGISVYILAAHAESSKVQLVGDLRQMFRIEVGKYNW